MAKIEYHELDSDVLEEIDRLAAEARKRLSLEESADNTTVLDALNSFIKDLTGLSEDEYEELSYELGALFGSLIAKEYGWTWFDISEPESGYSSYCVATPNKKFCCASFNYFYDLLHKEGSRNCKLLFNLMAPDSLPPSQNADLFTFLQ